MTGELDEPMKHMGKHGKSKENEQTESEHNMLDQLHVEPQRSSAALQKQCIAIRKFV